METHKGSSDSRQAKSQDRIRRTGLSFPDGVRLFVGLERALKIRHRRQDLATVVKIGRRLRVTSAKRPYVDSEAAFHQLECLLGAAERIQTDCDVVQSSSYVRIVGAEHLLFQDASPLVIFERFRETTREQIDGANVV